MKKMLCMLLCALLLCCAAPALGSGTRPTLPDSVRVELLQQNGSQVLCLPLETEMGYLHEAGIMGDGIMIFMPLEKFVAYCDHIPTIKVSERISYSVETTEPTAELTFSHRLFCKTQEGLVEIADEVPLERRALPTGVYLLRIGFSLKRGEDSYTGASFVWLQSE
ncbi:MAG: hypothetical protein IKK21_05680 [Clostridia bacterium]|nr:hypothetical protein [Clostridia bacterium]